MGLTTRSGDEFQIKEFGEHLVTKSVQQRRNEFAALHGLQALSSHCHPGLTADPESLQLGLGTDFIIF